jgi:hypothetical protein
MCTTPDLLANVLLVSMENTYLRGLLVNVFSRKYVLRICAPAVNSSISRGDAATGKQHVRANQVFSRDQL